MVLGIYGAEGSGREVCEVFDLYPEKAADWEEVVFIDDTKPSGMTQGHRRMPFENFVSLFSTKDAEVIIAVGEPASRKKLFDIVREKGYRLATIIHPLAQVAKTAKIGQGTFIQENVSVSSDTVIGENVYINGKTIIGHDTHIGAHCQISSFVIVAGHTIIGEKCFVGVHAALKEGISVGDNAIISMGAIVMKNVADDKVAMGNPAREIAVNNKGVFK